MKKVIYRYHDLEVSDEYIPIFEVNDLGELKYTDGQGWSSTPNESYQCFGFKKIINGTPGLKNKYINVEQDKFGEIIRISDDMNPLSLGKFKDRGFFLDKIEALHFQKEILYRQKNQLDEKIQKINTEIFQLNSNKI